MENVDFALEGDYIELIGLLKALGLAETGGHAKMMVDSGTVYVNGAAESRRRYKARKGDRIQVGSDYTIHIT